MLGRQPYLHDLAGVFQVPVQCWSAPDGGIGGGAQGIYCWDSRAVSRVELVVEGHELRWISTQNRSATEVDLHYVLTVPSATADPRVLLVRRRSASADGVSEGVVIESDLGHSVTVSLSVALVVDNSDLGQVKAGLPAARPPAPNGLCWNFGQQQAAARVDAPGAKVSHPTEDSIRLSWTVHLPDHGRTCVEWAVLLDDPSAPGIAARGPAMPVPKLADADPRLARLVDRSWGDLNSLRMADAALPDQTFLAAGAPWFYTMFGRDSLIAARMLLPVDISLAAGTLCGLAARQGTRYNVAAAEQPGKILHEIRRSGMDMTGQHVRLPPVYYGTIDATPLWIILLHDAWQAGMPEEQVASLLDNLEAALHWLATDGNSAGDGFLEYLDTTGQGLVNQGWKDSGDSIRWRDGSLAEAPIALCEVQGYAYQAAVGGAALLVAFKRPGASRWLDYAAGLADRFRATFWCEDGLGSYPALALDADRRPVDGVASNMGHLLGTGILNATEQKLVVQRLLHPSMFSGYGIRTLSTTNGGYWPQGYHRGSVWTHDTAIALTGMLQCGFAAEAKEVAHGLLRAAAGFDYRLPELFAGDAADEVWPPIPYPAACRPQAWAAASAVPIAIALGALPSVLPEVTG